MENVRIQNKYEIKPTRKTWIGAILLSSFCVLAQYSLPIMSYGLVIATIYGLGSLFFRGVAKLNKSMLLFVLWCLISQFFIYMFSGTFDQNLNTYFFMFVALFLLGTVGFVDQDCFFKVYRVFGAICSILVIYQFVLGNILGIPQSAIRILPVASEDLHFWIQNSNRTSGVFTEPQAFSSYILPLLIMLLFKKKYIEAIFISIAIFASSSSQGIILSLMIWGYYLVIYEKKVANKVFYAVGGAILMVLALVILKNVPMFQYIIEKIMSINILSYDIRLTKGFQIFFAMPLWDKITGIGFGNLNDYLQNGNFHFFWMALTRKELFAYITTMSNVLVSFGVAAFILYLRIFIQNRKTCSPQAKLLLLVIFVSSFTQTILFNAWFVFYWVVFEVMDGYDPTRYMYFRLRLRTNG